MQEAAALITALVQLGWLLIAAAALLVVFRRPLGNLVDRLSKFNLVLPDGTKLELTAAEVADVAQELLSEVDDLIEDVTAEESLLLAKVCGSPRAPTVEELFNRPAAN
jgi:hypothetical protein